MQKVTFLISFTFSLVCTVLHAQTDGYAPGPDVHTYYQTFGEGHPLLLINGGPGFSSEGFVPIAKELAKYSRKVIIYDQRATGKSQLDQVNASTITLDLMVADIENLRKHLEIDQWTVMGHSFGGMLAGYYASKHPEVFTDMIMSASGGLDLGLQSNFSVLGRMSRTERDSFNYWSNRMQQGDTSAHAKLKRATYLACAYVFKEEYVPVVAERLTQGDLALNGRVWSDMRRINLDCKPAMRSFTKPVLILQGKNDVIDVSIAESMHETFPNSQLVLIDDCGHYGWLDQAEQYLGAVREFLQS